MTFSQRNYFEIAIEKQAPATITKASFPLRYGSYSEIKTTDFEFRFNLNGEIKFIRGLNLNWPHPAEQLKRTDGNDWLYNSVGDDSSEDGVISWTGEYYLPCLPYPSNAVWEINYFSNPNIMNAFAAWSQLYADLYSSRGEGLHARARHLINLILENDDRVLHDRSRALRAIIGGRLSVLPPDTRHVDYEIIPLVIADGCLYHCEFCCVKSKNWFRKRDRADIREQVRQLKIFYGRNIENYSALFLGNHDALAAGKELVCFAAAEAADAFEFQKTRTGSPFLYLFGSVASLLNADHGLFNTLNKLPFYTYINIGFESLDASTLKVIGKPVEAEMVQEAFQKMLDVNASHANIEITGNFLMGEQLSSKHYESLIDLLGASPSSPKGKGTIYLSPLKDNPKKRELLPRFLEIKENSQLPTYIYLIQRL